MRITQTLLKTDMGSRLEKAALVVLAIVCGITIRPTAAFADTVSLSPQKDNTLYEDSAGQLSNGQGIYLFAGKTGMNTLRRGLIAFDPSLNYVCFQGDFTFDLTVVTFASPPTQKAGLTGSNWNVSGNILPGSGSV